MADGIDEAAAAFDTVMKTEPVVAKATTPKPGVVDNEGPADRMFENVGDLEVDEESPARGGGDDDDDEQRVEEEEQEDVEEGDESEEGDEEEESGEDNELFNQKVSVIVDGKEEEVSVKEAVEGYIRTQTFHRRMNDVEEAKKVIAQTASEAVQNYEYAVQLVEEINAHLEALVPAEPNWDEEFKKNPARARELQKYYEGVRQFKAGLEERMGEAGTKMAEGNAAQLKTYVESEGRRFANLNAKSWSTDPKRKDKDLKAMRRTALAQGFTEEEISQVYDSRMLQVLLKASKYDRMMASKPKPVRQGTAKVVASGAGPARSKKSATGVSSAMKRLGKTGSVEDAANVFSNMLRTERR